MKNLIILILVLFSLTAAAQEEKRTAQDELVQFSGLVLTEENDELVPLPFVNIAIVGTNRGTYSNLDGFFTIVGSKGDTVRFTSIGFRPVSYVIPDTLESNRYSVYQLMTQDTILLPETVIYPWPSREHFRLEFLAMDVSDELESRAEENLAEDALKEMREKIPADGNESADQYLRAQANAQYYSGQIRPMNILNPLAWKRFFEAWKRGDFKISNDDD
ncbi:MAG: carboxypeptidase-like regulatory domain-containing protein [Saprospiraceae bacterium]|nr:carboxypeptidase-like regulatory domain-containing protein [Saprospiraceae bacterium]